MTTTTTAARYEHDCPCCTYLGTHEAADLYYCNVQGYINVKARFSAAPDDVISGIGFGAMYPELATAERLARSRGFRIARAG